MVPTTTPEMQARVAPVTPPADDPFRYGWRYIRQVAPDGAISHEQVPLTLEDVLHPQEGDFIVQSHIHQRICTYLVNVLRGQLVSTPGAIVLADVRIAWDVPELKPHGPDIAVVFGVAAEQDWSTFDVGAEGARPELIIEVTLPGTRGHDLLEKRDEYDLAGVPLYVIVDIVERRGQPLVRMLAYRKLNGAYEVYAPDGRGWLWLGPVQLWLGVEDDKVYCYTAEGDRLGDYVDISAELEATSAELEAERRARVAEAEARTAAEARAASLEARLQALETQLQKLQGGAQPEA